jgi:hypothetical protein
MTAAESRAQIWWLVPTGALLAAGMWSLLDPGWLYLYRAASFVAMAAAINHMRMLRYGSRAPLVKTLVFLDVVILIAVVGVIADGDPSATEGLAAFLTPVLVIFLLITGFVVLTAVLRRSPSTSPDDS